MVGLRVKHILLELKYHSPFTLIGTVFGLVIAIAFSFFTWLPSNIADIVFHTLHPFHIFLSSVATTAVFWKHKKKIFEVFPVGIVGSIGICSISDIVIPYLGLLPLEKIRFHLCVLVHPQLIFSSAIAGVFVGVFLTNLTKKLSLFSHGSHVLVSALASTFYITAFGSLSLIQILPIAFAVIFVAVLIPCCTSDIVFPMLFIGKAFETEPTAHKIFVKKKLR
ncbi:hypothetical protein CW703_05845 [Candidatus Bathyarchaeota archaeon]|nr:MAG: hypothetical protein CW703_05845 [Candidatus Bathyarchaeota archaeon]